VTSKRQYSTSDPRWDDRVETIAREGWSLDDVKLRATLSRLDRRRFEQAILDIEERHGSGELRHNDTRDRFASPEQAAAAYAELKSERKAAAALHISRTHLRRLLGKDE
jgi:hypothetical protein